MANGYKVALKEIADDGTNTYCEIEISDGSTTMARIRPVFPTGTSAATIRAYMQQIADNAPTIAAGLKALVGQVILGN